MTWTACYMHPRCRRCTVLVGFLSISPQRYLLTWFKCTIVGFQHVQWRPWMQHHPYQHHLCTCWSGRLEVVELLFQSVCSKQCWCAEMAPLSHVLTWFSRLSAGISITEMWCKQPSWVGGGGIWAETCRGVNYGIPSFSDVSKPLSWWSCMRDLVNR